MMHKIAQKEMVSGTKMNLFAPKTCYMRNIKGPCPGDVQALSPIKRLCAFSRFLVLVSCLLFTLFLFARGASAADDSIPSLLDFSPKAGSYPEKVRPLAVLIAQADTKPSNEAYSQALAKASALLSTTPRGYHDEIYQLQAFALEKLGRQDEALQAYEKSLKLKSGNPVSLFRHALLLKEMGRCDEAVTELREVIWRMETHSHEALFIAAECLMSQGRKEEARLMTDKAYLKNPRFLPVLRILVKMREEQLVAEPDPFKREAIEAQIMTDVQTISELSPGDREYGLKYAQMLIRKTDPLVNPNGLTAAEDIARRFVKKSANKDEESIKTLFDALAKQGKLDEAQEVIVEGKKALGETPPLSSAAQQVAIERGVSEGKH
jgi:tetratricopeptide (TPR) repeat protein